MNDDIDAAIAESLGISVEELRERAAAIEFVPKGEFVEVESGHYVRRYEIRSDEGGSE